ncbi:hypothetical protein [uncultured Shewanella sp.]|uniref:hypothetical protein n=1 Tax=uncultured Shewanella sp. TaxID=173975 RepID=UPI0026140C36|nr:hypothetical protein [uncultured Shewanella sp.]
MLDPEPRNNGKGIHILKAAGIRVDIGLEAKQVKAFFATLFRVFIMCHRLIVDESDFMVKRR